jgi:hypothetical protein
LVAVIAAALIALALSVPRGRSAPAAGRVPGPGWLLLLTIVAGAVFISSRVLSAWSGVAAMLVPEAVMIVLVARWSRRSAWGAWHRLALASGALVTYAWQAFAHSSLEGGTPTIDLVSHVVLALGAAATIWYVAARLRRPFPAL